MPKTFYLALLFPFLLSVAYGQETQPYRNYQTQQVHHQLQLENLEVRERQQEIERLLNTGYFPETVPETIIIPIFFHVLYNRTEEIVGRHQIENQIEALNHHFKQVSNGQPEVNIQFCLANIQSPMTGSGSSAGMSYIQTETPEWQTDEAIKSALRGGAFPILPETTLNIWVSKLTDGIGGYAQLPGTPAAIDGIVIDYRSFGVGGTARSPYNEGKTLTHLVGSYLGLRELWNEYNYCADDGVGDTPVHNSQNVGCYEGKHLSFCAGAFEEMVYNFMDNSDDACQTSFTLGQMKRMIATLSMEGVRSRLAFDVPIVCTSILPDLPLSPLADKESVPIQIGVYPNPATDELTINLPKAEEDYTWSVVDALGRTLIQKKQTTKSTPYQIEESINLSEWAAGVYYVEVRSETSVVIQHFIIKR